MKKSVYFLICIQLAIFLSSCRMMAPKNQPSPTPTPTSRQSGDNTKLKENQFKFPEGVSGTGKGEIIVSTTGGTSEEGNVPVLIVAKETALEQIGVYFKNFQGDKEVFLFINKVFAGRLKGGEYAHTTLNLQGNNLRPGGYTVSAIQYENNDPTGKVVEYSEARYKIQQGSKK